MHLMFKSDLEYKRSACNFEHPRNLHQFLQFLSATRTKKLSFREEDKGFMDNIRGCKCSILLHVVIVS